MNLWFCILLNAQLGACHKLYYAEDKQSSKFSSEHFY